MRRIIAICLCVLALSCQRQSMTYTDITPLVSGILSDKSSSGYQLLNSYSEVPVSANLYVIGDAESTDIVTGRLLHYDMHDNVSGAARPDGLPDLAGETVTQLDDAFAVPYYNFFQDYGQTSMREHFVHHLLNAVDSVYSLTKYDLEKCGRKPVAKIVIFTDPFFARYGRGDTDILLKETSCKAKVLCPIELMRDELFSTDAVSLNVGIVCDTLHTGFSLYREFLLEKAANRDISCFSCCVPDSVGVLARFLDTYRMNGGRNPIDVLMIDNSRVNPVALNSELSRLRDLNRPECMTYGKLLSPDFRVIDGPSVVAEECYRSLRKENLFTHKIAYPRRVSLTSVINPGDEDNSFLLIPSDNVQN